MNDETRELLSAYLDGALPDDERRELEARIAASAELRRELDELRAVAKAVKDLPKEPLPPGFLVRFQARRARGDAPKADWVFLPPAARPIAFALSCAVVALVIWDKTTAPPADELLHPPMAADVLDRRSAPVSQLDLAAKASGIPGAAAPQAAENAMGLAGTVPEPVHRDDSAPRLSEDAVPARRGGLGAAQGRQAALASVRGRAKGSPLAGAGAGVSGGGLVAERGALAMTEEERSARNEQMFGYLESEKKRMGMKVLEKKDEATVVPREPAAPRIAAATPSLLKQTSMSMPAPGALEAPAAPATSIGEGRLSPDAGLVFSDARSLASSWVLLGFPGEPPATDFSTGRVVLLKPSATKILSVETKPNSVDVVYRALTPEETPDPVRDRVASIPTAPRTVLIFDASPR